jgi:Xaa-Pro dipeptidase
MREEATRPGRSLADCFADLRGFYADAGFPGEWRLHHQGGITGYASRELIATPYTDVEIEPGMAPGTRRSRAPRRRRRSC